MQENMKFHKNGIPKVEGIAAWYFKVSNLEEDVALESEMPKLEPCPMTSTL